jgi:hypothetical protein
MKKILLTSVIVAFLFGCLSSYAQKTEQKPEQKPAHKNGTAKFVTDMHDFGTIQESDGLATFVFEFTNTGTDPLILKNVQASCGCTTPDWPREPILPGAKGSIKVTYNPAGRPGTFEKNITVTSDGNPESQAIKIKGVVNPKPVVPQVKTDTIKKK